MFLGEKISGIISVLGDSDNSGLRKKVADLAAQIQSLNRSLSQSISSIDNKLNSYISEAKKDMLDTIFPVGSMYTQYPGALSPKEIFENAGYSGSAGSGMWELLQTLDIRDKQIWARSSHKDIYLIPSNNMPTTIDGVETKKYISQRMRNLDCVYSINYIIFDINHKYSIPYAEKNWSGYLDWGYNRIANYISTINTDPSKKNIDIGSVANTALRLLRPYLFGYDISTLYTSYTYDGLIVAIDNRLQSNKIYINNDMISDLSYKYRVTLTQASYHNPIYEKINIDINNDTPHTNIVTIKNIMQLVKYGGIRRYRRFIIYHPAHALCIADPNSIAPYVIEKFLTNTITNQVTSEYSTFDYIHNAKLFIPMVIFCDT